MTIAIHLNDIFVIVALTQIIVINGLVTIILYYRPLYHKFL